MNTSLGIAVGIIVIVAALICSNFVYNDKFSYCGVVVDNYQALYMSGKHDNTKNHDYKLDVRFNDGKYETITVTTDTWYKSPKGSDVCFTREVYPTEKTLCLIFTIVGIALFLIFMLGKFLDV